MEAEKQLARQSWDNSKAVLAERPLSPGDLVEQVALIQSAMKAVMHDGEHYGKIPGCGDKPSLLKPGAEKLGLTFRLAPRFSGEREPAPLGNGHREYVIRCELYTIGSERFVGSGLGSCSTLEAKYRYRVGPKKPTGTPVPKQYWDLRKTEPGKAQELLGGKGYGVGKDDAGTWQIVEHGEKVEHDNPADYYNTILKMAKKRAHVDAVLMATAASDIFTQDIEDKVAEHINDLPPQPNGERAAEDHPVPALDDPPHPTAAAFVQLYNRITAKWPARGGAHLLKAYMDTPKGPPTVQNILQFKSPKQLKWLERVLHEISENFDLGQLEPAPSEASGELEEPGMWGQAS